MKKIQLLVVVLVVLLKAVAQPKAVESMVDFQRTKQPAATITVPYPDDVVEKAIEDYMLKKGVKGNSSNGYKVFRNYKLAASLDHNSDLYFKADRKSRSEKDLSVIYLMVGKSTEEIKTRKLNDSTGNGLEGATALLDDMVPSIDAYALEVQVKDQEGVVKKAQKKYDDFVSDQKDGEKKIRSLHDKLEQNKRDQQKQSDDIKKYLNSDDKAMTKAQKKLSNLTNDEADYDKSLKTTMDKVDQSKLDQKAQQEEVDKQKSILNALTSKRKG